MVLVNPATYLSVATFKAQPNDFDISGYTDTQLQDILVRASGKADGYMRRSLLPTEVTKQFEGYGTNTLDLESTPICYVKTAQLVMPGFAPFALPLGQLQIDYERGVLRTWSPMIFQTLGVANVFPKNSLPILITFATGYGWPIPAPSFTLTEASNSGGTFAGGTYNFVCTTRTFPGESLPSVPQQIAIGAGAQIDVNITPTPGAYVYRIYASSAADNTALSALAAAAATTITCAAVTGMTAGTQWLLDAGTTNVEIVTVVSVVGNVVTLAAPLANAHADGATIIPLPYLVAESPATNYGTALMTVTVTSLAAPAIGALIPPTTDSSMWPVPNAIIEAVRLLTLGIIWEQNNLANRGIYEQKSNRKALTWKSTEGSAGKGISYVEQQAQALLAPFALQLIL